MPNIPDNLTIDKWYRELLRHPKFIQELSQYEKSALEDYIQEIILRARSRALDMAISNPSYQYPIEFEDDHESYWLNANKGLYCFKNANQILKVLRNDTGYLEGIEEYLSDKGKKLFPKILKEFQSAIQSNWKPKNYAFLIVSMSQVDIFNFKSFVFDLGNKTKFHRILEKELGKIGERKNLFNQIENIESDLKSDKESDSYKLIIDKLKPYLDKLKHLETL